MKNLMTTRSLIVLDTETTGFPRKSSMCPVRPVQVGAVLLDADSLAEVDHFKLLLNPGFWPPGYQHAEKVHGISRQRAEREGTRLSEGFRLLLGWLGKHTAERGPAQLMAWNAKFDRAIMDRWVRDASDAVEIEESAPWPDWSLGSLTAPGGCVLKLYQQARPNAPSRLRDALTACGLPAQPEPHDALSDARCAAAVLRVLVAQQHARGCVAPNYGAPLAGVSERWICTPVCPVRTP